jgi:hypothetical protein
LSGLREQENFAEYLVIKLHGIKIFFN